MSDRCRCTPYSQDAGGGYWELLAEFEPTCPKHGDVDAILASGSMRTGGAGGGLALTRIEDVSRLAWAHVPSDWSHASYYEPIVARVLSAALDAAEASGELPGEYLMRACFQAREKETR